MLWTKSLVSTRTFGHSEIEKDGKKPFPSCCEQGHSVRQAIVRDVGSAQCIWIVLETSYAHIMLVSKLTHLPLRNSRQ
jgi:hypothetical protein